MNKKTRKVVSLDREPVIGCECGGNTWYLVVPPQKDKVPRKVVAFECTDCGSRILTDINMEND